jgi:hypothetical protein
VGWEVSASWSTADVTATALEDYLAASGQVVFPIAATEQSLAVTVLGDTEDEPHETFLVELAAASGAVLLDPQGVGTIRNDDWCPRTPGYWKNHLDAWPVSYLALGSELYDAAELEAFLRYGGPDAASRLARHLTATLLNLERGSDLWIVPSVELADDLLTLFPPGSDPRGADRDAVNAVKDELDAYNNTPCEGD